MPATTGARQGAILGALGLLEAGGSTNGGDGIQLAYELAQENFVKGGINRVILATDGDFNVGTTSEGELTRLIEDKRKSGVFLTVLGFGTGNVKDSTMEMLADKGNGNYAYIDSAAGGAQGAGEGSRGDAGHHRQRREAPGRVQPGQGAELPPDRLREPAARQAKTSTTTRRTPARWAPATP